VEREEATSHPDITVIDVRSAPHIKFVPTPSSSTVRELPLKERNQNPQPGGILVLFFASLDELVIEMSLFLQFCCIRSGRSNYSVKTCGWLTRRWKKTPRIQDGILAPS
jgi:hypothetical protein